LHSTSRPTAVISCVSLVAAIDFDDLDGLQLQHPGAVLQLGDRNLEPALLSARVGVVWRRNPMECFPSRTLWAPEW
jgi:hypothetical protein